MISGSGVPAILCPDMSYRRLAIGALVTLLGCSTRSAPTPPEAIVVGSVDAGASDATALEDAAIPEVDASTGPVEDAAAKKSVPPVPAVGRLDRIDDVVREALERGDVTGAVVAVVRGQEIVFRKAYGLRTKDPDEPMKVDTVFDLASLTKALRRLVAGSRGLRRRAREVPALSVSRVENPGAVDYGSRA